jgi:hypothetical protein
MPDWLQQSFHNNESFSLSLLIIRQLTALGLGLVIAMIFRITQHRPPQQARAMMATIVMLTVLIGMMTLVIGDNVARAFSVVGALAIVRFRTIVEDTRDTGFVIFAVAVGMAIGAGHLKIALVTIPILGFAAALFRPTARNGFGFGDSVGADVGAALEAMLIVRVGVSSGGGGESEQRVREAIAPFVQSSRLTAITTARQGAAFEHTYTIRLRNDTDAAAMVATLNQIEGVQGVELRRT